MAYTPAPKFARLADVVDARLVLILSKRWQWTKPRCKRKLNACSKSVTPNVERKNSAFAELERRAREAEQLRQRESRNAQHKYNATENAKNASVNKPKHKHGKLEKKHNALNVNASKRQSGLRQAAGTRAASGSGTPAPRARALRSWERQARERAETGTPVTRTLS